MSNYTRKASYVAGNSVQAEGVGIFARRERRATRRRRRGGLVEAGRRGQGRRRGRRRQARGRRLGRAGKTDHGEREQHCQRQGEVFRRLVGLAGYLLRRQIDGMDDCRGLRHGGRSSSCAKREHWHEAALQAAEVQSPKHAVAGAINKTTTYPRRRRLEVALERRRVLLVVAPRARPRFHHRK